MRRARLSLYLFGPPRVERDGAPVATDRRKALALLAYLAVSAAGGASAHSRESLAALFWPDYDPSRALAYLRRALWELNRMLGEGWVQAERETVALEPGADIWVDVAAFQAQLARCRAANHACETCREALAQAAALYSADFLAGFNLKDAPGFDEWALFQSEGLRRDLAGALERLAHCHLQASRAQAEAAIPVARRWLALDQLNEAAHRCLMQVYELTGQHHLALHQYTECARLLGQELGVEPAAETQALYEAIKARQFAPVPGPAAPAGPIPLPGPAAPVDQAPTHNLPSQLSKFIGREQALAEVRALLAEARLVTLVGPGGIGKTRLALQAAGTLVGRYAQGVWLVELAGLADPAQTFPTVATVLGVREDRARPLLEAVKRHLRQAQLLLVLDNCEHLIEACARLAAELLAACPGVRIVATSREPLAIGGESTFPVPPLALPPEAAGGGRPADALSQYEAVQLFVERAAAAQPGFSLSDASAAAVAHICRHLDGIPLALELAAARVKVLSVEQIAARLDDRFRLLTGGSRTALPRQQTLRALIDWSYDLLPAAEQRLLARLSVFAGGWTLEAAEAVAADSDVEGAAASLRPPDVLEVLAQLVHKSLVVVEHAPSQAARYRQLETIRQYAREKLEAQGNPAPVRQRHLDYYTALAEAVEPDLRGSQQVGAFNRLGAEVDNLRAALEWSLGHGPHLGMRLAGALMQFWYIRGYWTEGRMWLEQFLAAPGAAEHPGALAKALNGAAFLASMQEDHRRAQSLYEQSLPLWRATGQRKGEADTLRLLGSILSDQGDPAQGRALLEQSLALSRADGDREGIAWTLYDLGRLALFLHDTETTRRYWEESLALHRALNHTTGIALVAQSLAEFALLQGDLAGAEAMSEEALAIARSLGDLQRISGALYLLSELAQQHGEMSRAMALMNDNLSLVRQLGNRLVMAWVAWRLGYLAVRQGDTGTAHALLRESLDLFQELGQPAGTGSVLAVLAMLRNAEGRPAQAARLIGAAEAIFTAQDVRLNLYDRRDYDSQVALIRERLGEGPFAARVAEGRELTTEQAVAEALSG